MTDKSREMPATAVFYPASGAEERQITSIEGGQMEGTGILTLTPLVVGDEIMYIQAFKQKGMIDPEHIHPDHESLGYLASGKLRLVIDGEEFIANPGDTWLHRRGVPHYSEALEDSVQIEVKSPPTKTW
jgi:quercetin dioxygenase-like cupin family protein